MGPAYSAIAMVGSGVFCYFVFQVFDHIKPRWAAWFAMILPMGIYSFTMAHAFVKALAG